MPSCDSSIFKFNNNNDFIFGVKSYLAGLLIGNTNFTTVRWTETFQMTDKNADVSGGLRFNVLIREVAKVWPFPDVKAKAAPSQLF